MSNGNYSRRTYLKAAGVLGASGLIAGCNESQQSPTDVQTTAKTSDQGNVQAVDEPDPQQQEETAPEGWANEKSEYLDIKLLAEYDSSGDAAWDPDAHPRVYVTSNGPGYSGRPTDVENVGVKIIDAETREVVTSQQYEFDFVPFENHGCGVSYDGNWIYIPTGNSGADDPAKAGRLLIINAETLKLDKVLMTRSSPHHIKTFERYDGKPVTLAYTFGQNIPSYKAISPGSGHWIMDPDDDHKVIDGMRSEDFQTEPYLSFPHPDGKHLFVGCDSKGKRVGHGASYWAVVNMEDEWSLLNWYTGGGNAIWTTFTADGRYAFSSDGHHDIIYKHDCKTGENVAKGTSGTHGVYGITLNKQEDKLYTVGKGEGSHNLGKTLGLVNPETMEGVNQWPYNCVRGDHALVNPWSPNELWTSCNANQVDSIWDMENDELITTVEASGSSHNGAFVDFGTSDDWKVQYDQARWHGYSKEQHLDDLGIDEVMDYGVKQFSR